MKVGIVYPQIELGGDPDSARRFTAAVADNGFSHLLAYDHVLGAARVAREPSLPDDYPYDDGDPFHDPFVLFAHLSAIHPDLGFMTGILILPQRQTALVARQAADVALLSGNRLRLGVGVGWNHVEYDALGQDFSTRGRREDDQIPLLRRLWSEDQVTHHSDFESLDRVTLVPRPTQTLPIWVGGFSAPAFDRGARLGDGFLFGGATEAALAGWSATRDRLAHHGREVEGFGADWLTRGAANGQGVAERVETWRDAGGTHASIVTMGLGLDSVEAHIDEVGQIANALA